MIQRVYYWLGVAVGVVVWAHPLLALDKSAIAASGTITNGNAFYRVHVQDIGGSGIGLYTATTGPSHPAGSGLNVLFGGGFPGTSYNTIRSYTTGTDYVQSLFSPASPNPVVGLDPFGAAVVIGTTGARTTYTLPGPPTTPDALTIVQDVNVNGTTFANSTVEVTTRITNNGAGAVQLGVRYLWDFQIGADDGPSFQQQLPGGAVLVNEAQFLSPAFGAFRMEDNGANPSPPTFNVFGTVAGPASVVPPPTAPDLLQFVCWPSAFSTAFDYTVTPAFDCSTGGGDTAVLYFFGHDVASALTIPAGGTRTLSASLFVTLPAPLQPAAAAPVLSMAGLVILGVLLAAMGMLTMSRRRSLG